MLGNHPNNNILYASNVHTGGGLVLLQALMRDWPVSVSCHAFLDIRARNLLDVPENWLVTWCGGRFADAVLAEWRLSRSANSQTMVLMFQSLPPIFPVKGTIICYVHNPYVVDLGDALALDSATRRRTWIKRQIFNRFAGHVDKYIVQTPSMKRALSKTLRRLGQSDADMMVAPYTDFQKLERLGGERATSTEFDYLYVSDGVAHKNHRRLFGAWVELADRGVFPSLAVTLPNRDHQMITEMDGLVARNALNITNLGHMPHDKLLKCYAKTGALIFPSYAETFGLPLLEAKAAGLPILASEMDYARDVCEPVQTFDPFSEMSIARAVLRHRGVAIDSCTPLTATDFALSLLNRPPKPSGDVAAAKVNDYRDI